MGRMSLGNGTAPNGTGTLAEFPTTAVAVSPEPGNRREPQARNRFAWFPGRRGTRRGTHRAERDTARAQATAAGSAAAAIRSLGNGTGRTPPRSPKPGVTVPPALATLGAWIDLIVGYMPLIAPLVVSGWFTFHVFSDGLAQPWPIALILVLGLEGVAWKLARLYEKRLVAGHSTLTDRAGILVVVGAIGTLIYWHADQTAKAKVAAAAATGINLAITPDWRPAAVASGMAALGVFVWSRQARWDRRVELEKQNRIDMAALRIGIWQWIVSPWESLWGFRHGMKFRIPNPVEAVTDWRNWKQAGKPKQWPPPVPTDTADLWSLLLAAQGTAGTVTPADTGTPVPVSPAPAGVTVGTRTGTARAATPGTEPELEQITAWREIHRERLHAVRDRMRDWQTRPDVTVDDVQTALGCKRSYAGQVRHVLLYDRTHPEAA